MWVEVESSHEVFSPDPSIHITRFDVNKETRMNDQTEDIAYINRNLNELADIQAQLDVIELDHHELIDSVLTDEIKEQLADIDYEFDEKSKVAKEKANNLRDIIKAQVIELGDSVKGEYLHAVYNKGRVSWDTKALNGYAAAHPDVLQLRKTGDPSVTIRVVK